MGHTEISTSTVWRVWLGLETGASPTHFVFAACVALEHSLILSRSHNSRGMSPQFSAWKGGEIIGLFTQLTALHYPRKQKQSGTLHVRTQAHIFGALCFFLPHTIVLTSKFTTGSSTRVFSIEVSSLYALKDPKCTKNSTQVLRVTANANFHRTPWLVFSPTVLTFVAVSF